ncbi:MAG: hypothetical protein J6S90_05385, partial [Lentisphaeria bacterium]|nr:hypothetical protein [Lentisphaeria bacterium]
KKNGVLWGSCQSPRGCGRRLFAGGAVFLLTLIGFVGWQICFSSILLNIRRLALITRANYLLMLYIFTF